jgi:hypothetical protein
MKNNNKKLTENASHLGTPFGLATMLRRERDKRLGIVTQSKEESFVCFVAKNGQHFP